MLSATLEKQRHQLYAHAVDSLGARLRTAEGLPALLAAVGWGLHELDRICAGTPAKVRATVACRSGCDFCCRGPIDVQAHEVFFTAAHLQSTFPPAELAGVIARTAALRARAAGRPDLAPSRAALPCALLIDGRCSAYTGRPAVCRAHHSRNAAACREFLADPDFAIEQSYIPALRARTYAVMLGLDAAMAAAGFDDRAYDFGSALHAALTDSLCAELWSRRKPAFPDSCLAPA
jgi:Fe-S-cluster containining protein